VLFEKEQFHNRELVLNEFSQNRIDKTYIDLISNPI